MSNAREYIPITPPLRQIRNLLPGVVNESFREIPGFPAISCLKYSWGLKETDAATVFPGNARL